MPTGDPEAVAREEAGSLYEKWRIQLETICSLGFSEQRMVSRTLVAPACGTGSLSLDLANKVLTMTRELADMIRRDFRLDQPGRRETGPRAG